MQALFYLTCFYLRYAGLHVAFFYPISREGLNLPTTTLVIFMEGLNIPTTTVFKICNANEFMEGLNLPTTTDFKLYQRNHFMEGLNLPTTRVFHHFGMVAFNLTKFNFGLLAYMDVEG